MAFWKFGKRFKEPLETKVYTTVYVMNELAPIRLVSHELDGDWQFMGGGLINEDYKSVAVLVSLGDIIKHDRSLLEVADLPPGYQATRKTWNEKWEVEKIEYGADELRMFGYYCSGCGEFHKEIPLSYGAEAPVNYFQIPEEQRHDRCVLTSGQCIIDNKYFYIRGCLELSIEGSNNDFIWNLWVEVTKSDFDQMSDKWEDQQRILEPVKPGVVATEVNVYPQTCGLPVKVITRNVGVAPKLEIVESNHPLYFEQEAGIDMSRVFDFAKKILYNH